MLLSMINLNLVNLLEEAVEASSEQAPTLEDTVKQVIDFISTKEFQVGTWTFSLVMVIYIFIKFILWLMNNPNVQLKAENKLLRKQINDSNKKYQELEERVSNLENSMGVVEDTLPNRQGRKRIAQYMQHDYIERGDYPIIRENTRANSSHKEIKKLHITKLTKEDVKQITDNVKEVANAISKVGE